MYVRLSLHLNKDSLKFSFPIFFKQCIYVYAVFSTVRFPDITDSNPLQSGALTTKDPPHRILFVNVLNLAEWYNVSIFSQGARKKVFEDITLESVTLVDFCNVAGTWRSLGRSSWWPHTGSCRSCRGSGLSGSAPPGGSRSSSLHQGPGGTGWSQTCGTSCTGGIE